MSSRQTSMIRPTVQSPSDEIVHLFEEPVREIGKRIDPATNVVVLTGAGMSAESGVPTFRGREGLWRKFRPEELANFDAFVKNPDLVQNWYAYRKEIVDSVEPNAGHFALTELQSKVPNSWIVTQNVDNLHQRAGSRNVIELHGNIFKNYCIDCGTHYDGPDFRYSNGQLAQCECGGLIRPDVVWFGENLPEKQYRLAERVCCDSDILLSVGTSGIVYPAAGLPAMAQDHGAFLVEINPEPTEISSIMDIVMRAPSGTALPAIVRALR